MIWNVFATFIDVRRFDIVVCCGRQIIEHSIHKAPRVGNESNASGCLLRRTFLVPGHPSIRRTPGLSSGGYQNWY